MPRRGKPPTKAPGGLDRVLYVRIDATGLAALDALVDRERAALGLPGLSRSDAVRRLLRYAADEVRASRVLPEESTVRALTAAVDVANLCMAVAHACGRLR